MKRAARKPAPRTKDGVPDELKPFLDDIARIIAAAVLRELNVPVERKEVMRDAN